MNNLSVLESLGAVGVGSLELLVAVALAALSTVLALLTIAIKLRGQGRELIVTCTRDVLLGCAWGATLLGFPVALYFVGRAFWRAATWPPGQHELTAHCS